MDSKGDLNVRIRWNAFMAVAALVAILSFDLALAARQAGQGQAGGAAAQGQAAPGQRGGGRGGQRGANLPPAGPAPRLPNGKPDLSGHWNNPYTPDMARGMSALDPETRMPLQFEHKGEKLADAKGNPNKTFDLPYTEWGLQQWKDYDPEKNGDYAGSCYPFGMSRSLNSPHGVQVIHSNDALAFLWEQNTWFHWVPLDPNFKWPKDLPASWNGISTGHWDGDTLVVVTSGFNGYTRLDTNGHPHSKDAVFTNTFLRTDSRTIQHTFTVHDPKAFTHDWMNVRMWTLKPATDVIMEYSCEENNISLQDGTITRWHYPDKVD
jgi:hypothetical protein